ncbi:hypothetical protein ACEPAF_2506 [Sanghuangporus sanghuang]
MSTIANVVLGDSDDDYDPDFVPEDQSDTSEEETVLRPKPDVVETEAQKAEKEKARASLWESFQASVSATTGTSSASTSRSVKLVTIERRYRFAGEEVSEVIEVPEDSEDARKWPRWIPQSAQELQVPTNGASREDTKGDSDDALPAAIENKSQSPNAPHPSKASESSKDAVSSTSGSKSTVSTATKFTSRPKPGPRKPKTTLAPLPSSKPKKLTTLEKSAMDWRSHISQSDSTTETTPGGVSIADELERNRRSGGYLEKVAFLERVGNRREDLFEESRKKRRKG